VGGSRVAFRRSWNELTSASHCIGSASLGTLIAATVAGNSGTRCS